MSLFVVKLQNNLSKSRLAVGTFSVGVSDGHEMSAHTESETDRPCLYRPCSNLPTRLETLPHPHSTHLKQSNWKENKSQPTRPSCGDRNVYIEKVETHKTRTQNTAKQFKAQRGSEAWESLEKTYKPGAAPKKVNLDFQTSRRRVSVCVCGFQTKSKRDTD